MMHSILKKSIGFQYNLNNITTIGYVKESPKQVLQFARDHNIQLAGYKLLGQLNEFGHGLIIESDVHEQVPYGVKFDHSITEFPFQDHGITTYEMNYDDIVFPFRWIEGRVIKPVNSHFENIYGMPRRQLNAIDKIIRKDGQEYLSTMLRSARPITYTSIAEIAQTPVRITVEKIPAPEKIEIEK